MDGVIDVKCSILNYGQVNHFNYNTGYNFAIALNTLHTQKKKRQKGGHQKYTIQCLQVGK